MVGEPDGQGARGACREPRREARLPASNPTFPVNIRDPHGCHWGWGHHHHLWNHQGGPPTSPSLWPCLSRLRGQARTPGLQLPHPPETGTATPQG